MANKDREDGEESKWTELVELFYDEYTHENDDGSVEIINKGAGSGELLYKWSVAKMIHENDGVPTGWAIEAITLVRLNNDILDEVGKWEKSDAPQWELALIISDDVVLFYTLANEVIHGLSGELLNKEIVREDRRSDSSLRMTNSLPQETKEDLLFYSGIINNGLKGEMASVRKTRNKLVHELRDRHYLTTIENVESRLERSLKVIDKLHELRNGDSLFINF